MNTHTLVATLLAIGLLSGCGGTPRDMTRSNIKLQSSQAQLTDERAALVRQYRECLKRAETDPAVDCSSNGTAVERQHAE